MSSFYIGGAYRAITNVKAEINKIYHVVVTYDGKQVIQYVNGKNVGSVSVTGTIKAPNNSTVMAIGTNPNGTSSGGELLNGRIYNAKVYTKGLTEREVWQNYTALDVTLSDATSGETADTTANVSAQSAVTTNGLVAYVDALNNSTNGHSNTTSIFRDLSNSGNYGSLIGGTWGSDYLKLNGSSDWVNLGEISSNYMTLETTFSLDKITNNTNIEILNNLHYGGAGIYISASGCIQAEFHIGGAYQNLISTTKVETNKIYNVSASYNGSEAVLYINGQKVDSISIKGTIGKPQNDTVMALGINPQGSDVDPYVSQAYFNGKIYTARVYNRSLTETEVKQNYWQDCMRYDISSEVPIELYVNKGKDYQSGFNKTNYIIIEGSSTSADASVGSTNKITVTGKQICSLRLITYDKAGNTTTTTREILQNVK